MSSTAREVALAAVLKVTDQGGYSNLAVPGALRRSELAPDDRAFATELAYGTLRRLPLLDREIGYHASRPASRMTGRVRAALRIGAYQIRFMRTPPHAAVSATVALLHGVRERGFVNAVLRHIVDDPLPPPSGSDDDDVALRSGLAGWAVGELRRLLGEEAEIAAEALGERAPLSLRVNTCSASVDAVERALRDAGLEPRRGRLHPEVLLLERAGDPSVLPGFGEGWVAIQDQASAFVVRALDPQPGDRVLDVCAGPGGKSVYAACLVEPDGIVVAGDVHVRRAVLIERAAARLRVRPLVLVQDGRRLALRGPFDRILVDAPCSGIGSARRRPELLWRSRRQELSGLARLQVGLVGSAADLLRPGGRLVYSVCTFPRAETDATADAIVRHRPDLVPVPTEGPDGPEERVRLWPHRHGSDAMFVAAFRREP